MHWSVQQEMGSGRKDRLPKPAPSDGLSPARLQLSTQRHQLGTTCSNAWACRRHFSFKSPHKATHLICSYWRENSCTALLWRSSLQSLDCLIESHQGCDDRSRASPLFSSSPPVISSRICCACALLVGEKHFDNFTIKWVSYLLLTVHSNSYHEDEAHWYCSLPNSQW